MEKDREFAFTDKEFDYVRKLVHQHTGISLAESKRELVYGRLARRLRKLNLDSFVDYCELLKQGDPEELEQFTNAITTNLTSFFREDHHFTFLAQTLLPALRQDNQPARRLRVWSAGCSSGEEPYSIAMTVREAMSDSNGWDIKILATDLDSNVLARGSAGVYKQEQIDNLPRQRLSRWFLKGRGDHDGMVRAAPALREMISFRQLNLMAEWPMRGPFDIIFCRNVAIYFDKPTQKTLFDRFADLQGPGGHLFIGHSESLFKVTDRYRLIGKTIYQKVH